MATRILRPNFTNDYKPSYGWLTESHQRYPNGFNTGNLAYMGPAILNLSSDKFLNKGKIWKVSPRDDNAYGVPNNQTAAFIEAGYIAEQPGDPNSWSSGTINNFTTRIGNIHIKRKTDSMDESYTGAVIRCDQNKELYYQVYKGFGQKAMLQGDIHDGTYQPDLYVDGIENANVKAKIRACIASDAVLLEALRVGGMFNRWGKPEFEADQGPDHKCLLNYKSIVLNQYIGPGGVNGRGLERFIECIYNIIMAKRGRAALGLDGITRILNFAWANNCETAPGGTGFSAWYNRAVANGTVQAHFFPNYSPAWQMDFASMAFFMGTDLNIWNDPSSFGTDPLTMADSPVASFVGNGAGPTKVPISDANLSGIGQRGYPFKPQFGFDVMDDGVKRYEQSWTTTNNQVFNWYPVRRKDTTTVLPATDEQPLLAYEQGSAFCRANAGTGADAGLYSGMLYACGQGSYEVQLPNGNWVEVKDELTGSYLCARHGYAFAHDAN